jgi:cyanate permease
LQEWLLEPEAQIGGFIGPTSVGYIKDHAGNFSLALAVLAGFALLAAVIAYLLNNSGVARKSVPIGSHGNYPVR